MNNITLVGNPNTGKTTLFNSLTNSREKASNWHGVTVKEKEKSYKYKNEEFNVVDLPGMYSLNGRSNEEKIAAEYLNKHKEDLVVNICDANNLKRNLILTLELLKKGLTVILAVNMANETKLYNYEKLSKILNIRIVEIDARKNKSVNTLKDEIYKIYQNKKPQNTLNLVKNQLNYDDLCKILNSIKINNVNPYLKTNKIDRILLNKFLFIPIFLCITFLIFYITFGPFGELFLSVFEWFFNKIFEFLRKIILCLNISNIVQDFLINGVLLSILTVLNFIPQIILLMFFVNFLEDIGYMSRVAFMFDGLLKRIGLTGKSLFSLTMGFGCTTTAVLTTRNLENKNLRKRTVLVLPFISCSAKLPVFLVIASLFFDSYKYLFVFTLYLFSIFISIIMSIIYNHLIKSKEENFILEMPKYRLPNLKKIFIDTSSVILEFLVKIGTTILFFSIILWFLQNFSTSFSFIGSSNFSDSILYFLSNKLSFLFGFIGLSGAGIVVAILLGIVAKEMVVVGLAMINGVSGSLELLSTSLILPTSVCYFTPISSIIFLVFILLYSPCMSALSMIKNELGTKTALYVFFSQFAIAFLICWLLYHSLTSINFLIFMLVFIVLDILFSFMLKFRHKKKHCLGNCDACKRI